MGNEGRVGKEGKIIDNKIFFAYRKDVPEEEVKNMEQIIKNAIDKVEKEKPRCTACFPCPMGIIGCEWNDVPHGHGCGQTCTECGVTYYKVHPHSKCSKGTPVRDDVKHDEKRMKSQLEVRGMYKI